MSKENFIRFKNQILGGTVLRDGNVFAEILGDVDFEFWRNVYEMEPYLRSSVDIKIDNVTKGKIILERLEKETSPKQFVNFLKVIYDALAFSSATPRNFGDSMWLTYVHRLQAEREATGFADLEIKWTKEPEAAYTREQPVEKYYIPGELEITYKGEDWDTENSKKILENGFHSDVLQNFIKKTESATNKAKSVHDKYWYEKPIGIVLLTVIGGIVVAGIIFWLGWN